MASSIESVVMYDSVLETDDGAGDESVDSKRYRELCPTAVVGAALGCASIVALANPAMVFVPIGAAVVNVLALRKISSLAPQLMGRRLALMGLALALIFAIAGPMQPWVEYRSLEYGALETAREWFVALRNNEPELAHQLTKVKWQRQGEQIPLKKLYTGDRASSDLKAFVAEEPVRSILASGKASHIRFQETAEVKIDPLDEQDDVVNIYEVTVPAEAGKQESFRVEITASWRLDLTRRVRSWSISKVQLRESGQQATAEPTG